MKEGYLVFDLGTGNSRVAIGDETGNIIGIRSFENIYHQESRNPEAKYFIPKEWLQKILLEMKLLLSDFSQYTIRAVTATSAREGIVLVDQRGSAFIGLPNIDKRGNERIKKYQQYSKDVYRLSGHWLDPLFSALKLLTYKENYLSKEKTIIGFTSISEWIGYELTGKLGIAESQACETQLYDTKEFKWSEELMDIFEVEEKILPDVYAAGEVLGYVGEEKIPFIVCGADTQMAVEGVGAKAGDVIIVSGTTSPIVAVVEEPLYDEDERCWFDCVKKGRWLIETNAGTTGLNYQTYRKNFLGNKSYKEIEHKIAEKNNFQCIASFGTKFFSGKKSLKQGGVFSYAPLSVEFDRIDVMNAIMADIACGITLHYRELQKIKSHDKKYVIGCGGGFQSQTLGKRIASLINKEVVLPPHYEQASLNGCIKICQKTLKKSVEDHDHVRIIEPGNDILLEEYYEKWRTVRKIYEEVEF